MIGRREVIRLLGGAAAWPLTARGGNPVVRRTMIYWIGGLLGLLVLSGCKSDRLSERGQPFSAASINSMHGLRS